MLILRSFKKEFAGFLCQFCKLSFICKKKKFSYFQGLRIYNLHRLHRECMFEDCARVCMFLPQYKTLPSFVVMGSLILTRYIAAQIKNTFQLPFHPVAAMLATRGPESQQPGAPRTSGSHSLSPVLTTSRHRLILSGTQRH